MKVTDSVQLRVRYSETDQMGVVYHGSYVPYFEVGRVEWLRNRGLSYKELEDSGVALPIVKMNINYKRPARYDDMLTIQTTFVKLEGVKIQFHCDIYSEANELLTTAEFLLVFVDIASGKPCMPSYEIKNILEHLSV